MKKIYKNPWKHGLKKLSIMAMAVFGISQGLNAQVNAYSFSQSSGTFNSISASGTVVAGSEATTSTTNDGTGWSVTIPFGFNFNGTNYTSIYVNSNGGATFGTTTNTGSTLISSTSAFDGSISVMNRDLWGVFITSGVTTSGSNIITNVASLKGIAIGKALNNVNGIPAGATVTAFDEAAGTITMSANATSSSTAAVVRYGTGIVVTEVQGSAPNRVFVIEWIGYNDYGTTVSTSNYLNFQLRLSETTNTISTVYGPNYNVNTAVKTNQVGLRGASNSDYNARSGADGVSWNSTVAGTSNSASVSRSSTNFPASGLTFVWTPPSACTGVPTSGSISPASQNLLIGQVSSPFVLSGYSSGVTGLAFQWQVSTDNITFTDVTTGTGGTTSTYTPPAFDGVTKYYRCNVTCTNSNQTASSQAAIIEGCAPVATFSQNFDSVTTPNFPSCWGKIGTTGGAYTQGVTTMSAPNALYIYSSSTSSIGYVSMPTLNTLQSGLYKLRFKVRANSSVGGVVQVGYLATPGDVASFVSLGSYTATSTTVPVEYSLQNIVTPAGANNLIFKHTGSPAYSLFIDDVVYELMPSCAEPTAVTSSAITNNSATIGWTAPTTAPANGYEYYYSTSSTAPISTTVPSGSVAAGVTTANLTLLNPTTQYYVWVRSVCSATDKSAWSSNATFTTLCAPTTVPFLEAFSGGVLPSCWTSQNPTSTSTDPNVKWKFTGNADYGASLANNGRASGTYAWVDASSPFADIHNVELLTPQINLSGLVSPYVSFDWFKNHSTSTSTTVSPSTYDNNKLSVDVNNGSGWTNIFQGTSNAQVWRTEGIALPASYVGTTIQLRFTVDKNTGTNPNFYDDILLDNVEVKEAPSCLAPNNLAANPITASNATITWTAPTVAPVGGYDVYYATTNTAPTSTTVPQYTGVSTLSQVIPGTSGTTYYAWVRSHCDATNQSSWVGPVTYTILYLPPANDNCSGAVALTPGASFAQNAIVGTTIGATLTNDATAVTPCQTTRHADTWYSVVVPTSGNITIETRSVTGSPVTDTVLGVYSGSCGSLTLIECDDDDSTDGNFSIVSLTGQTPGSTLIIGVWNYSPTNNGTFQVSAYDASLSTSEVTSAGKDISVYPNPFSDIVNISDIENVKSISVVDLSGKLVKTFAKAEAKLNLSDLPSGMFMVVLNMKDGSKKSIKVIKK